MTTQRIISREQKKIVKRASEAAYNGVDRRQTRLAMGKSEGQERNFPRGSSPASAGTKTGLQSDARVVEWFGKRRMV